ncbi:hypothetical protein BKA64DRAFT_567059 [Cadophora sp. MPI-SDFR-AT-0126]|nr:hypothetical protein BKA64DRAFT_567059 [Leotiomycetes sp. MPI-SDFR-AT-0126]
MGPRRPEKERQCPYCPRTFTKEEHLNRHRRSHTGEKPFHCHKCSRKYSRSDVLSRHLQTHTTESPPAPPPPGDSAPPPHIQHASEPCSSKPSSIPPNLSAFINMTQLPLTQSQLLQGIASSENHETLQSSSLDSWSHARTESGNQQHIPATTVPPLPELSVEHEAVSGLDNTASGMNLNVDSDETHVIHTVESQFSIQQIMQISGSDEADPFGIEVDFGAFGYLSPGMMDMDYLDDVTPRTPLPLPPSEEDKRESIQMLLSAERLQQIQRMWRGKRSAPGLRLIRSLWNQVIQHESDNIFSEPMTSASRVEPVLNSIQTLRWGMNGDRRKELITFCTELEKPSFESPPPGFSPDGFPTKEALDASVDFFFRYFPMPFVHKATFDATTTPASLLFPMCLIGLAALYPEPSRPFVLRYQKVHHLGYYCFPRVWKSLTFQQKLMRFCRSELTSIALGHCSPGKFLSSIASTFLVIAEKHGLFAASLGDDISLQLQTSLSNDESLWKTWARVESIKRMVVYLLWMDAAYSRLMGSSGVVNIDKVELHLPCDATLFDATSFPRFIQRAKQGAHLVQARIKFQNIEATAPDIIDSMAMQTVLSALYLQIAAARHDLGGESNLSHDCQPCSRAEMLSMDPKGDKIVSAVILLPRKYSALFHVQETITSLAWNNLCLGLTADLDLLEVAFGRDGVAAAHASMVAIMKWSRSASARRAILHASQVFKILSSSRLDGSTFARPDLLLFLSALVLGMYVFVVAPVEEDHNSNVFELLQDIDWVAIDDKGMRHTPAEQDLSASRMESQQPTELAAYNAAREFIQYGGPISFSKEDQIGGAPAARKILLSYMHLLDDLGKWRGSRYSRLLRTMSDFVTEDNS